VSTTVSFNGSTYTLPQTRDTAWGTYTTAYLAAIAAGAAGIGVTNVFALSQRFTLGVALIPQATPAQTSDGQLYAGADGFLYTLAATPNPNTPVKLIGGTGTVTSVGLTTPAFLTTAGSPVTTSGTLAVTLATQTANTVFAGPTTGAAAAPTFRALVAADIPGIGAGIVAKTANYIVLSTDSGNHFTNTGAAGSVAFTLPTPATSLVYTFTCTAAQTLTVVGANSTAIVGPSALVGQTITIAGGVAANQYTTVKVTCYDGTHWIIDYIFGTATVG